MKKILITLCVVLGFIMIFLLSSCTKEPKVTPKDKTATVVPPPKVDTITVIKKDTVTVRDTVRDTVTVTIPQQYKTINVLFSSDPSDTNRIVRNDLGQSITGALVAVMNVKAVGSSLTLQQYSITLATSIFNPNAAIKRLRLYDSKGHQIESEDVAYKENVRFVTVTFYDIGLQIAQDKTQKIFIRADVNPIGQNLGFPSGTLAQLGILQENIHDVKVSITVDESDIQQVKATSIFISGKTKFVNGALPAGCTTPYGFSTTTGVACH